MNITYGNLEGPHFTQSRVDELKRLAEELNEVAGIVDFHIWYHAEQDFHKLSFVYQGRAYIVRYYKLMMLCEADEKSIARISDGQGIIWTLNKSYIPGIIE